MSVVIIGGHDRMVRQYKKSAGTINIRRRFFYPDVHRAG